jgi:hypothetical protein
MLTRRTHHAHGYPFFTQRPVARVPCIEVPVALRLLFYISGSFMFPREANTALIFRRDWKSMREIGNTHHHHIHLEPRSHDRRRRRWGYFMDPRAVNIHESKSGGESVPGISICVERKGVSGTGDPSCGYNHLCTTQIYLGSHRCDERGWLPDPA